MKKQPAKCAVRAVTMKNKGLSIHISTVFTLDLAENERLNWRGWLMPSHQLAELTNPFFTISPYNGNHTETIANLV
jgi:hypothetical protein